MLTMGIACGFQDAVTLDEYFTPEGSTRTVISTYITVGGSAGQIVFENSFGNAQVCLNAFLGINPIAARRVLTSGTVNGVSYETTATQLGWQASVAN